MIRIAAGMLLAATSALVTAAGPFSKFNEKPPLQLTSGRVMEDVERCLIDMDGMLAPIVYRQPDRPDAVSLLWKSPNGLSVGRVDLARTANGTLIRSWFPAKQVAGCAG